MTNLNTSQTQNLDRPEPIAELAHEPANWYILQHAEGHCDIVPTKELAATDAEQLSWGPYASQSEAIAKRVGLIRSGKCKPV